MLLVKIYGGMEKWNNPLALLQNLGIHDQIKQILALSSINLWLECFSALINFTSCVISLIKWKGPAKVSIIIPICYISESEN